MEMLLYITCLLSFNVYNNVIQSESHRQLFLKHSFSLPLRNRPCVCSITARASPSLLLIHTAVLSDQRRSQGGAMPPQSVANLFFEQLISGNLSRCPGNVKKCPELRNQNLPLYCTLKSVSGQECIICLQFCIKSLLSPISVSVLDCSIYL